MGETQDKTDHRYDLWVSLPPTETRAHPAIALGAFRILIGQEHARMSADSGAWLMRDRSVHPNSYFHI
jgi:hypothetical protein